MADSESILQLGIDHARAGDKAEARDLFRLVTREDPNNAQGWLWLAGVAEDREEKRAALEHVLRIDPSNDLARKGLAQLGGPRGTTSNLGAAAAASSPAATTVLPTTPATPPPVQTPPPPPQPERQGNLDDLDFADSLDSMDLYDQSETTGGARSYNAPDENGWSPPDFGDDDDDLGETASFDLSDYQNRPRVTAADIEAMEREQGGTVVIEGEGRRAIPPWFLPVAAGVALFIILLLGYTMFKGRNSSPPLAIQTPTAGTTIAQNPNGTTTTGTTAAGATTGTAAGQPTAATGATSDPSFEQTLPPDPNVPTVVVPTAAAVTAEAGTPVAQTPLETAPAPLTPEPAQPTTIVIEPGGPTVVPGDQTPVPSDQTPVPSDQTPVPSNPTAVPPSGDVATANPAIVAAEQPITAGQWQYQWNYGYGPLKTDGTGNYGGVTPSRGQWLSLTIAVTNNGQPTTIPDGFFVLKDAQNRVYDFNRAASVDWLNRFGRGVAADTSAADQFNNISQSVVLLFDVPADATNLVLFSRENLGQGYLVR